MDCCWPSKFLLSDVGSYPDSDRHREQGELYSQAKLHHEKARLDHMAVQMAKLDSVGLQDIITKLDPVMDMMQGYSNGDISTHKLAKLVFSKSMHLKHALHDYNLAN